MRSKFLLRLIIALLSLAFCLSITACKRTSNSMPEKVVHGDKPAVTTYDLLKNGQSGYKIVIAKDADDTIVTESLELQGFFK